MKLAVFGSLQNFNTEIYSNTFLPFNKTHVLTCNLTPLNMKAKNEGIPTNINLKLLLGHRGFFVDANFFTFHLK